jgi:hypothetical protein
MITSSEKLLKLLIKNIAKKNNLDYTKLKEQSKKIVKLGKEYDEKLFGIMEELMDLQNIGTEDELKDFDSQTLAVYCKIKDIDITDLSDKRIRKAVWESIEEEDEDYEPESADDSDDSDDDSNVEVELEDSDSETEPEPEPVKIQEIVEPPPEPVKEKKSKKKAVSIVESTD